MQDPYAEGVNTKWAFSKPCENCGKNFVTKRKEPWGEAKSKYCCRKCQHEKQKCHVTLTCQNCEKHYVVRRSLVHRKNQGPRRFCSHDCKHEYWRKHGKADKRRKPHRNSAGYIYVYAPEHPSVRGKNYRRVAEHRLVMEEILGRYLQLGENVHHKNGVKDDNSPENLELWTVGQPAGQTSEYLKELVSAKLEIAKLKEKLGITDGA